jgi:flavin-dependent dehydrogenase
MFARPSGINDFLRIPTMIAPHSPGPAVIVVGGGPAGATAARTLARAGVPVRLLDRAVFPRNKPCGGGISVRVLSRFPHLERELPRIATHAISRLHLEGPDGSFAVIESDGPAALMVRRVEFDALLVALALEAGADLLTGVHITQAREHADGVTLTARDGRQFTAPLVIAADGVNSVVARRLGLNRGWAASSVAIDMMEETPRTALRDVDPATLWVAYGYQPGRVRSSDSGNGLEPGSPSATASKSAAEGYAYIFPKRDHVNVGIGYLLSYFRHEMDETPYTLQRQFVAELRRRGVVTGESVKENFTPFLIPVGGPLRRPGRGRVLIAGDAAGFVNGFTAEGIFYAMVTGELAARAVIEASRGLKGVASAYRRACNDEIGAELRDSVLLQRYLFADRKRLARLIAGARQEPAVIRLILDLATGRRPYRDVRRRILARSPLLAGRLAWTRVTRKPLSCAAEVTRI